MPPTPDRVAGAQPGDRESGGRVTAMSAIAARATPIVDSRFRRPSAGDDGNARAGGVGKAAQVARVAGENAIAGLGDEDRGGVDRVGGARASEQDSGVACEPIVHGTDVHGAEQARQ